jgi:4-hydroxybenzoate polyprenyltransferase
VSERHADARSAQDVALARLRRKLEREARAARAVAAAAGNANGAPTTAVDASAEGVLNADGTREPAAIAAARTPGADAVRAPHRGRSRDAVASVARSAAWAAKADAYERLIRLDKPIGWLLLLWPTLTALWISCWGSPSVSTIVILVAGTILMRSAGCAFNDWADRDFDAHVKRTAQRPLATGEVSPREALVLGAALAACAFALVLFTNRLTVLLAFPALAVTLAYPFTKRFLSLPQAFLGIAFSFGIPMAFAAQTEAVPVLAWALLAINLFWVMAYDTEYAMVDRDDDIRLGMRTSAITFGRFDVAAVACCYAINLAGMAAVGAQRRLAWPYYAGLALAAAIAAYHVVLIRGRDRDACFKAFRHNHWYGLAVFAGTVLALWWRYRAWPTFG